MILLNELRNNTTYSKKCILPVYEKDKLHSSLIILLGPNIESSINQINDKIFINQGFNSYYIENDINVFLSDANIMKENEIKNNLSRYNIGYSKYDQAINIDQSIIPLIESDDTSHNMLLRRLLYNERFKTPKEIVNIYERIKLECDDIKHTFLYPERYKNKNLFLDFYYYNQSFFNNNNLEKEKGLDVYLELLERFIYDKRFSGYKQKFVMIPVNHWKQIIGDKLHVYTESINPISVLYRLMTRNYDKLVEIFGDTTFIFTGNMRYMKINFKEMSKHDAQRFLTNINQLSSFNPIKNNNEDNNPNIHSKMSIKMAIIDKLEKGLRYKINNLTGTDNVSEKELLDKIEKASEDSTTTEEAMEKLNKDDEFKQMLLQISSEVTEDKISPTRRKRLDTVNGEFMKKKIGNMTVEQIVSTKAEPIQSTNLNIDSVNEEWEDMTFMNFNDSFNMEQEILNTLLMYNNTTMPMAILDVQIEDKSTSEDLLDLYTIKFEDANGKRHTVRIDVPKLKDGKFLVLKGNTKKVSGQLMLKPIIKSDRDTVQIVSDYKKIFIRRSGQKSDVISDRTVKTLKKNPSGIKAIPGNNKVVNSNYIVPYDYEYIGGIYNKIESNNYIIYFNQEEIRTKYEVKDNGMLPYAYDKKNKQVMYVPKELTFAKMMYTLLSTDNKSFAEIYETTTVGKKYMYSKASILNAKIPLIIVCAYNEGLTRTMNRANIKYEFLEKKPKYNPHEHDCIRFADGYLLYELTPESSLFMNGLKDCGIENYSMGDINSRDMYLDILDRFGSRVILSDGLENFYDLMIDPKTKQILEHLNLPVEYCDVLIYANSMLADNSYIKHTDMNGYRYRSTEIITACVYSALANGYEDYKQQIKNGKKDASFTVKQNAAVNEILMLPTTSDFSIINPLYELEAINEISYKGKSGMNSERAYGADKRAYNKTMVNNVAMSTNFAGNVGINRQMTVNANVKDSLGFMETTVNKDDMGVNTFCATELMTPYGALHSDPMRTAMTFIQKAKHQMRTSVAHPALITTGMDDAMPYMLSNTFVYKAKEDGKIIEMNDRFMIIEYKDKTKDMISLEKKIVKNSDGGFYSELQLSTNYKEGQTFKKNEILAHDPLCFSRDAGYTNNLTYNAGTLIKMAKIYSDETFEDSTIISDWLSEAMSSDVVLKKKQKIYTNTDILFMAKKGDPVQEGDTLLLFQQGFEDEDVKKLLAKLSDNNEDAADELGRRKIKSKVTGWVEDIKIYRTVDIDQLSPSVQKIVNAYEADIKKVENACKKHSIDKKNELSPTYKLEPTGNLKGVDGVLIEIYLKYKDDLSVGDKIVFYDALKGVARGKFPAGQEPYTMFRPDEKIHAYLGLSSVMGRMVCSVDIVMALTKGLVELDRQCKQILGIPVKYIDQM